MSTPTWTLRVSQNPNGEVARFDRPLRAVFHLLPNRQFITLALNFEVSGLVLWFHDHGSVDSKLSVYRGSKVDDDAARQLCDKFLAEVLCPHTGLTAKHLSSLPRDGGLHLCYNLTPT